MIDNQPYLVPLCCLPNNYEEINILPKPRINHWTDSMWFSLWELNAYRANGRFDISDRFPNNSFRNGAEH